MALSKDGSSWLVESGDYLDKIAKAAGTTSDELAALNNIKDKNLIFPGQVIKFSAGNTTTNTGTDTGPTVTPYISGVSDATQTAIDEYEKGYTPSETVNNAYKELQNVKNNKPTYTDSFAADIDRIYNELISDHTFTYDLNGDALYNQYKNQYTTLGTLAMQDTMGQAAALTGGYGSSYATTAGNQAYQSYLQQLNNVVPELYNQAYQRYQDDISNLYNQYSVASDMRNTEYNQYRDSTSDYYNDLSFATDAYNTEKGYDFGSWQTMLDHYTNKSAAENADYWTKTQWDYTTSNSGGSDGGGGNSGSGGSSSGSKGSESGRDSTWLHDYVDSITNDVKMDASNESIGIYIGSKFYSWVDLRNAVASGNVLANLDGGMITYYEKNSPTTQTATTTSKKTKEKTDNPSFAGRREIPDDPSFAGRR